MVGTKQAVMSYFDFRPSSLSLNSIEKISGLNLYAHETLFSCVKWLFSLLIVCFMARLKATPTKT